MDLRVRLIVRLVAAAVGVLIAVMAACGIGNIIGKSVVAVTPYDVNVVSADDIKIDSQNTGDDADVLMYNRNLFNQKGAAEEPEETPEVEDVADVPEVIEEIAGDGVRHFFLLLGLGKAVAAVIVNFLKRGTHP